MIFRNWVSLIVIILAGCVLAFLAISPPSAQSENIAADKFSSGRAMKDVRIIAQAPHPTGSAENAQVRAYLEARLKSLDMQVSISPSQLDARALKRLNKWSGETKTAQTIYNVVGVLPGRDSSQKSILLMAHHDTVWGSPGAADDTVGIASILEIIRAVKQRADQKRDIIVLFTDAEELGLQGARAFFKDHAMRDKVGAILNFEARGGGGTANMFQTSTKNEAAVRLYARSVKQPSLSSLSTFVYDILPNDTDLTPALEKDYIAYNIANIGRAKYYHSPEINAKALDERTLQHMGSQGLDLTRALIEVDMLPSKTSNASFFDLYGIWTVIFAPFWGWIFLLIGGVCLGASVRFKGHSKEIISGAIKMVGFLIIGGAGLYGLNYLSGSGDLADYYDRLAAIPKLEITAFFACLAVFLVLFGHKSLSSHESVGAVLPLLLLGIICQAFAPSAVYFLTLSILLYGIIALLRRRGFAHKAGRAASVILAALVLGYMIGLGHLLMLGVGADMLSVAILPAALAVLAVLPFYHGLSKRFSRLGATIALSVSIASAIWIRMDPIASSVPLY